MDTLHNSLKTQLQKILDMLRSDLATVRIGRATPAVVENVMVSVYGGSARMKIMEVATITASDSQTLLLTPFDSSISGEIQKGILEANIGLTPSSDGHVIRISIPPLSQERREELIHVMKQKLENARIMVRQSRQASLMEIKKQENSQDEQKRLEKEVQQIVDEFMATIDGLGKQKEHDLLQI